MNEVQQTMTKLESGNKKNYIPYNAYKKQQSSASMVTLAFVIESHKLF